MARNFHLRLLRCLAFIVSPCLCSQLLAQSSVPRPGGVAKSAIPAVNMEDFLPRGAANPQKFSVDFNHDGSPADTVLTYESIDKKDPSDRTTSVRILHYIPGSGWKLAFENSYNVENGGGGEGISVDEIIAANGKIGLFVLLESSGAGTATSWEVVASVNGKFVSLDPADILKKVLDARGYEDWGYNTVDVKHDVIFDSQPGYSHHTARCCPDRPSIDIRVRFTGSSLELVSVKTEPFTPQKY
jgi:hypothetical protein